MASLTRVPMYASARDYWAPSFEVWDADSEMAGIPCGRLVAVFNHLLEALDFIVYSVAYCGSSVVLRGPHGTVSRYPDAASLGAMTHHVEAHGRKAAAADQVVTIGQPVTENSISADLVNSPALTDILAGEAGAA